LPVQLRTDVHSRCAELLRSDAVRLKQFRAIRRLLCHRHKSLLRFLPVQLRTAMPQYALLGELATLCSFWPLHTAAWHCCGCCPCNRVRMCTYIGPSCSAVTQFI
jgi:hypothetical protein